MNIGSFFKALVAVAESDAKTILLPVAASATASIATNQGAGNLAAQGANLLQAAVKFGPQVGQDELQTLADIVADYANAANTAASTKTPVTPASAAAAAVEG